MKTLYNESSRDWCNNCEKWIIQKEFDGEFGCPHCKRTDCIITYYESDEE